MNLGAIVLLDGSFQGERYPLTERTDIGRHPNNGIVLFDRAASLFHATVVASGEGMFIEDLGSRNGTHVNGKRVRRHALKDDDEVVVGKTRMRFEAGGQLDLPVVRATEDEPVSFEDSRHSIELAELSGEQAEQSAASEEASRETTMDLDPEEVAGGIDDRTGPQPRPDKPAKEVPPPPRPGSEADARLREELESAGMRDVLGSLGMQWAQAQGQTTKLARLPLTQKSRAADGSEPSTDLETDSLSRDLPVAVPSGSVTAPDYFTLYTFLRKACKLVATKASLKVVLNEILDHLFTVAPVEHGCILLHRPSRRSMEAKAVRSRVPRRDGRPITVSRTIVSKVVKRRVSILAHDAMEEFAKKGAKFQGASSILDQQIRSVICAPLLFQDELLGVLYIDTRNVTHAFDKELLKAVHAISGPASIAIKNSLIVDALRRKNDEIRKGYIDTVYVLANSIEARDRYTIGHSRRVTGMSAVVAKALGWSSEELDVLKMGCVLHDIGKVGIEDAIIRKKSALTKKEYDAIKRHPLIGANILKDVTFLKPVLPYILYHHERWDGKGYPAGLKAESVPIKGRLLCIADAFDAMTSSRPYRNGMDPEEAVEQLRAGRGSQFDPKLVDLFVQAYDAGKLDNFIQTKNKNA